MMRPRLPPSDPADCTGRYREGDTVTSLRKLERDFARRSRHRAGTSRTARRRRGRYGAFRPREARRDELQQAIETLEAAPEEAIASAALFFGGGPVIQARRDRASSPDQPVTKFQDIVAKVLAHETGGLGQRECAQQVRRHSTSPQYCSWIIRFSSPKKFNPSTRCLRLRSRRRWMRPTRLLDAFGEPDGAIPFGRRDHRPEGCWGQRASSSTSCAVAQLFVSSPAKPTTSFGAGRALRSAPRRRLSRDSEETIRGQLAGVLPDAHQFEFRTGTDRGTIRGRVNRALPADQLTRFNRDWVNVDAGARFACEACVAAVQSSGGFPRFSLDPPGAV